MQEYDHEFKCLMKDNERFADLFNHTVPEGKAESETEYTLRMRIRDDGLFIRQMQVKKRRGKRKKLTLAINLAVFLKEGKWHAMKSLDERMDPEKVKRLRINSHEEKFLIPSETEDTKNS